MAGNLIDVDYRALVSRADLRYDQPVKRSEEGMPVGNGRIEFVQVKSQAGGECRIRNPWPDTTVALERNGDKPEQLSGDLLRFSTTKGEVTTIRPSR